MIAPVMLSGKINEVWDVFLWIGVVVAQRLRPNDLREPAPIDAQSAGDAMILDRRWRKDC